MIKIVESGTVGRNWYRKYSDGWIEQGGYVPTPMVNDDKTLTPIKFHIPFINVPLSLRTQTIKKNNTAIAGNQLCRAFDSLTNTTFWVVNDGYGAGVTGYYWEASGY